MMEDEIIELIERADEANLNAQERIKLNTWLAKPGSKAQYAQIKNLKSNIKSVAQKEQSYTPDTSKAWQTIKSQLEIKEKSYRFKVSYVAAAAVAFLAIIVGVNFIFNNQANNITVIVQSGQKDTIVFNDGSKAYAVGPCKISYTKGFDADLREVAFSGLAFFDIERDVSRPFIINTSKGTVDVLGTSFTVNTQVKNEFTVQCVSGKVRMTAVIDDKSEEVILTKNEMGSFNKNENALAKEAFNPALVHVVPKTNLIFEDRPLSEIITAIEEKHKVKIKVDNPAILNLIYSTNLNDNTLKEVFSELELTFKLKTIDQSPSSYLLKKSKDR